MASTNSRRVSQLKRPKENARNKRRIENTDITTIEETARRKEIAMGIATDATVRMTGTTATTRMDIGISDHDASTRSIDGVITVATRRNIHT